MKSAIDILQESHSADLSAGWFRAIFGTVLGASIIISVLYLAFQCLKVPFVDSLDHLAMAIRGSIFLITIGPFITAGISLLVVLSDMGSRAAVAIGNYRQPPNKWQSVLIAMNIGDELANAAIGYVMGWVLRLEVAPLQYLTYFYVILVTLTIAAGIYGHTHNIFRMWMEAALLTVIFTKPVMLLIMAVSGNVLAHLGPAVGFFPQAWVYGITVFTPSAMFLAIFVSMVIRRVRAKRRDKVEAELRQSSNSVQEMRLRHHVTQAGVSHVGGMAATAAGAAVGTAVTGATAGNAVAGKVAGAGTAIAIKGTSAMVAKKVSRPRRKRN